MLLELNGYWMKIEKQNPTLNQWSLEIQSRSLLVLEMSIGLKKYSQYPSIDCKNNREPHTEKNGGYPKSS